MRVKKRLRTAVIRCKERKKRAVTVFICWALLAIPFVWREYMPRILVRNVTASLPLGFYLIMPLNNLQKGDYVSFTPPEDALKLALERQWIKQPANLLKTAGALPGNSYTVTDEAVYINGRYIGPVYVVDSQGRPMPKIRGSYVVKEGYFLPISTYRPQSYDGRYYGEVPLAAIRYKVWPLLTDDFGEVLD